MVAAASLPVPSPPSRELEQRVLLAQVPWATYVVLRDTVTSARVRMTYLKGWLEIMSPSRTHEVNKKQIARLIELFCLERDIPLYGYGSTTFRNEEAERGLEPDECYCRGANRALPDIAIEVVVSAPALEKLEVYRGLGVREVWLFGGADFQVFALRDAEYVAIPASEVLPELELDRIAHYATFADQHSALRDYRDELRARPAG